MTSQYNESDDDLPLHTRGGGRDYDERGLPSELPAPEREVTLNTGIVLGLFFALAALCAVFFGFGYSIGHKSAPAAAVAAAAEPDPAVVTEETPGSGTRKPSPGVPGPAQSAPALPVPQYVPPTSADASAKPVTKPSPQTVVVTTTPKTPAVPGAGEGVAAGRPAPVIRVPAAPTPQAALPQTAASGTIYVQVAAVSHQEDADVLLSALRRKGYAVTPRSEPADRLIHVQIGPFATRKDADSMRQRLAGDGYNAFIK